MTEEITRPLQKLTVANLSLHFGYIDRFCRGFPKFLQASAEVIDLFPLGQNSFFLKPFQIAKT
jgi:hypothetical protein